MDSNLAQDAISAAISGKWSEAVKLNEQILSYDPKDVDALNRLARAYSELGNFAKARKTASTVLKIDQFNSIATRCLAKWKGLTHKDAVQTPSATGNVFLEEPGKTKIIQLLNLGSTKLIANLSSGDEVRINPVGHRISFCTIDGKYIGKLSDDLSGHLRRLINLGNEYKAYVKSIDKNDIRVFVREVKRAKEVRDIPSFSSEKSDYVIFDISRSPKTKKS